MNLSIVYKTFIKIPKFKIYTSCSFCIAGEADFYKSLYSNSSDDIYTMENLQDYAYESIFKGIVLETKDFLLLNKPAGISLFRNTPLQNLPYNGVNSKVTVSDVLPRLSSELKLKDGSLIVSSELPWSYSGLFVVSKSKKHAEICKAFFKNSSLGKMPGYINQLYRCLCWNVPKSMNSPVTPFSYTFLQPDPNDFQYSISYKCNLISKRKFGQRKYWRKYVGHDVVSLDDKKNASAALVDVKCNSTYRGILPLYLLHQGCIVIGETAQASRLVHGGNGGDVCILPPEKANASKPVPIRLRQRLGILGRDMRSLPVHIHCQELLVPSIPGRSSESKMSTSRFNTNSQARIHWDGELKLFVCSTGTVPEYYQTTMNQLGVSIPFEEGR